MCQEHFLGKSSCHCAPQLSSVFPLACGKLGDFLPRRHPASKPVKQLVGSSKARTAPFCCLPKLRKGGPAEGCPTTSAVSSAAYHASRYLHSRLVPLVKQLSSCCVSPSKFLSEVRGIELTSEAQSEALTVAAGAAALCPSTPHSTRPAP